MSKAKFYQGPLFAVKNSADGWEVKVGSGAYDQSVAFIGKNNEHIPDFDAEGQAIFFSAAPELLAALNKAREALDMCRASYENRGDYYDGWATQALVSVNSAIAKATLNHKSHGHVN